jgi:y4mF family transcriptional regulator
MKYAAQQTKLFEILSSQLPLAESLPPSRDSWCFWLTPLRLQFIITAMTDQSINILSMPGSPEIGTVLRYHRRRSGLSQSELATLAGIGKTSVFDIEKGKSTVRLATLMAVLRALNIVLTLTSPLMAECLQASQSNPNTTQGKGPS